MESKNVVEPSLEALSNEGHATLRVSHKCDGERHFAQIVPSEIVDAARDHAVLFTKRADTGRFYIGVVMGLEPGRNLSTVDGKLPGYRPADLVRAGFFLAEGVIAVDRGSAAIGDASGQPIFDDEGQPTVALRQVQRALQTLHDGLPTSDQFIERFLRHKLIEPIDVSLSFDDGSHIRLDGLYTISLDRLHDLPDVSVLELFRSGDLQLAYAQAASIAHLRRLARTHNDRLSAPLR